MNDKLDSTAIFKLIMNLKNNTQERQGHIHSMFIFMTLLNIAIQKLARKDQVTMMSEIQRYDELAISDGLNPQAKV